MCGAASMAHLERRGARAQRTFSCPLGARAARQHCGGAENAGRGPEIFFHLERNPTSSGGHAAGPTSLPTTLPGRPFGPAERAQIQARLRAQPPWSRSQRSRELARRWQWRTAAGRLKDLTARTWLRKLEQRGCRQLPPQRRASPTRSGRIVPRDHWLRLAETPVIGALVRGGPVVLPAVSRPGHQAPRTGLEECLRRQHYLGCRSRVGQNLQYWVHRAPGQPLAGVGFGAAARRRRSAMPCHSGVVGSASTTINSAPASSHSCSSP